MCIYIHVLPAVPRAPLFLARGFLRWPVIMTVFLTVYTGECKHLKFCTLINYLSVGVYFCRDRSGSWGLSALCHVNVKIIGWALSPISVISDIGLRLISEPEESEVRHYIGYRNKHLSSIRHRLLHD
jgi:hypothetical protein